MHVVVYYYSNLIILSLCLFHSLYVSVCLSLPLSVSVSFSLSLSSFWRRSRSWLKGQSSTSRLSPPPPRPRPHRSVPNQKQLNLPGLRPLLGSSLIPTPSSLWRRQRLRRRTSQRMSYCCRSQKPLTTTAWQWRWWCNHGDGRLKSAGSTCANSGSAVGSYSSACYHFRIVFVLLLKIRPAPGG